MFDAAIVINSIDEVLSQRLTANLPAELLNAHGEIRYAKEREDGCYGKLLRRASSEHR